LYLRLALEEHETQLARQELEDLTIHFALPLEGTLASFLAAALSAVYGALHPHQPLKSHLRGLGENLNDFPIGCEIAAQVQKFLKNQLDYRIDYIP